ncbi:MAG TPA: hypothetical protein VK504_08800 [Vicinamibacterales bacterium]|nr:hypothetical protein [Vicinamibacterales bacterium]
MRRPFLIVIAFIFAARVYAITPTEYLLAKAWPYEHKAKIAEVGRGVGIVFSPDLSVPGNCRFYQSLGFACFEEADWDSILSGIRTYNILYPERAIRTLVIETHGTNGNGLKVQNSYDPAADRSYISVGALQERIEADGVRYVVISACNSRRLLRPAIYRTLDPYNGDKLFLPATLGIINASEDWDPRRSRIVVATPATSHIEQTLAGTVRELSPTTRRALTVSARSLGIEPPKQFAVSEMLMQMLLRDPTLEFATGESIDQLSRDQTPDSRGEKLFRSFVKYVNQLSWREYGKKKAPATKRAAKTPASKSASVRR